MLTRTSSSRVRQRGVGLVETMVGILIGMIVIVVVYNILSVAEGYKRVTIGASDAQITGLMTQFVAGRDAGNGGAGVMMSAGSNTVPEDLALCTRDETGALISGLAITALDAAVRPVPVLITNGVSPLSDSFITLSTGASHVMWPVDFTSPSAAGAAITVQSPNGFTVPAPTGAAPYWVVTMANDPAGPNVGRCKVLTVTAASVPDAQGRVTLTQGAPATSIAYSVAGPARLLNLGPQGLATRIQYDVDNVNAVLRTTDLLVVPPNPFVVNPIAQNIVLMKVQYGIDTTVLPVTLNGDGTVDCWTPAVAGSVCGGDYSAGSVRNFTLAQLNRILAVRIGVVVRSDEPDLKLLTDPTNLQLQDEAKPLLSATRPPVVLFNCSTNNAACQSRVVVTMGGTPTGSPTCLPNVICDYWRYRTYETVIPLRNAIFAATMPP